MSRVLNNKAAAPYYDDYNNTKQYTQLLAVPGKVAQAREFTQMQSTMKDIIKSIGDSLLKDGDIIEGCQVIVSNDHHSVTVTTGKIYIQGMVLPVAETTVAISGIGTETIGAKLVEYVFTEQDDPSLKDPAQGYDNYNQAGCHRLKSVVTIVVNDIESAIISTLIDGAVSVENYAPEYDTLTQTLARRTYDESGSYLVEGLKVRTEESSTAGKYNVVIEPGKAYVLGFELKIPNARRIVSNKALTYSAISSSRTYISGTSTYTLYSDHPFIRNIISVIGAKEVSESLSNSANGNKLSHTSIINDQSYFTITQESTTYVFGTDYTIDQQGGSYYVVWTNTGTHPDVGTSYSITYRYNKEFSSSDYTLVITTEGHAIKWEGGDNPEANSVFTVNYNQYLARKDIVYIDRYGTLSVLEGTPAEYNSDVAPEAPLNSLILAIINNPPNGSVIESSSSEAIYVDNIGLTRFTMRDIQLLLDRLKTVEYDQAILSLNDEARNDDVANKKGIFTDPLVDLSRIDFYFNKNSITYDMALDLVSNIAYLPVSSNTNNVSYSDDSTSTLHDRLITLETTGENVVLSQPSATKRFLVNPYSVFPQLPVVYLTPSVDTWIDDTIIEVPISIQESSLVSMSTRTIDNRSGTGTTSTSTSSVDTAIGTRTNSYSTQDILSENAVTYIRQRTLTVEGHNFYQNLNNITGYFDGVKVDLTPVAHLEDTTSLENTQAGTVEGTVKANSEGYLKATFQIPENILTGTRELVLKSEESIPDGYVGEGFTFYVARGTARTIRNTVTTVTTVLLERVTTTTLSTIHINVDPVGQTFVLDRMTMVKGIDLYFGDKPAAGINIPVSCEIRGVNNGTITPQLYAHASLNPDQITTSDTAAIATRFNFRDPVLLEENKEYAFVVKSTSDAYSVWVADLGGVEISTVGSDNPKIVLKNAYMTGVMLSSSNNSTWTSHQTTDIKFQIIENTYSDNSIALFNDLSVSEFSRIYLSADSAIPADTSVAWYYKLNGEVGYKSITPYNIITMNQLKTGISLKAELSKLSASNLSPMIALDSIGVTTSCYDNTNENGYYISKNISGLSNYTKVKVIVDTYEPTSDTNITVKISTDDGETLVNTTKEVTTTPLSYGWEECYYNASVAASTNCRIFIKATSANKYETPAFRRLRVIFSV